MKVFGIDIDNTMIGGPYPGPVTPEMILRLRNQGNIVGIAGNYHVAFRYWKDWWKVCSFFGALDGDKPKFLRKLKADMQQGNPNLKEFIMVGNKAGDPKVLPSANDDGAARLAGWKFIDETSFAGMMNSGRTGGPSSTVGRNVAPS